VDGDFGARTHEAVVMFQRQQNLFPDGIVGPRTRDKLNNPDDACAMAREGLIAAGASEVEADRAVRIGKRESGCHLAQVVDRPSTGDLSFGPYGVNYIGDMMGPRSNWLGPPWLNIFSWKTAGAILLKLARESGWCHWTPVVYCSKS